MNIPRMGVVGALLVALGCSSPGGAADLFVNALDPTCGGFVSCFSSIQSAVDAAGMGDTIHVQPGTYTENVVVNYKSVDVVSTDGPQTTIIDGGGNASPFVIRASTFSLNGFTIRNGGGSYSSAEDGWGVYVTASWGPVSATISNNIIRDNAIRAGVGIDSGTVDTPISVVVSQNQIFGNPSGVNMVLPDSDIGDIEITDNIIAFNGSGLDDNGGIQAFVLGCSPNQTSVRIFNNTIWGNYGRFPGGLQACVNDLQIANNIIFGNSVRESGYQDDLFLPDGATYFVNNVVGDGQFNGIDNNTSADPMLADPASGHFGLTVGSPAIDAGENSFAAFLATDVNGNPRTVDGDGNGSAVVDIGAVEFGSVLAPNARDDSATTYLSTPTSIDVLANDVGFNDPATVTLLTAPAHGSAEVTGSPGSQEGIRIRYTASVGYSGTDNFVYQVTDGITTASASVAITVRSFKATSDNFVVQKDQSYNFFYVATNDLGFTDPVTISLTARPNRNGFASVYVPTGPKSQVYLNYDPEPYVGDDYIEVFGYRISDGVHTDTATITVHVVAFLAQDDFATANVDAPVTIDVGANDLGFAYPATAGLYTAALHGTVQVNGSPGSPDGITMTYRPSPGFTGTDTFQYAIDDGTHLGFATVTVHVIHDVDLDGIEDAADNCVDTVNADQRDSNGDGYGNACDADLNDDGNVNFADLAIFRQRFATNDPDADLDGNGTVNFADLSKFRTLFGRAPGPSALHSQN